MTTSRRAVAEVAPEVQESNAPRAQTRSAEIIAKAELGKPDRSMTYILITMGALVVVGGVIAWISISHNKDRREAEEKAQRESTESIQRVEEADRTRPEDYNHLFALLADADEKTKPFPPDKNKANLLRSQISARKEAKEAKENAIALLENCEKDVKDYSKLDTVKLKLPDLMRAAGSMDKPFQDRAKAVDLELTINRMKAAYAKAQEEAAAAGSDPVAKLAAYDKAVVVFRDYFKKLNNIPKDDPVLVTYRDMLKEADGIIDAMMTPDYIESTRFRDMLSPTEIAAWGASEGIRHEFLRRELILEGVLGKEGKKVTGIMSIAGWKVPEWHDLYLEYEFEIVSGGFEMFLRYRPDGFKFYSSGFKVKDGYKTGETYKITAMVKGSTVTITQNDQPLANEPFDASVSRTGGVGFAITEGSKVILKNVKLKVLRPRGA